MSSHHNHKAMNLHHNQVTAGKQRRYQRQLERVFNWQIKRRRAYDELCVLSGLSFVCFAYSMFMPAAFLAAYY